MSKETVSSDEVVAPAEDGGHAISQAGRDALQPHGLLLIVEVEGGVITQVGCNAAEILGYRPDELVGKSLASTLGEPAAEFAFRCMLGGAQSASHPAVPVRGRQDKTIQLEAGAQRMDEERILLEFPPVTQDAQCDPSADLYLRAVDRILRAGESEALDAFCTRVCREIRSLTGFDRVLLFRFARDGNAEIIGEDGSGEMEPFLGATIPSNDFPTEECRLYSVNWLRWIPDVNFEPVRLEPARDALGGQVPDLSRCLFCGVEPEHLESLKRGGIGSSLTISLMNQLWGAIVCHHPTPLWPSYQTRATCAMLGSILAAYLGSRDEADRARRRLEMRAVHTRLMNTMGASESVPEGLTDAESDLTGLVNADGVAILFGSGVRSIGVVPSDTDLLRLKEWLDTNQSELVYSTDCLSEEWDEAEAFRADGTGMISLKFWPHDYLIFFRREQDIEVVDPVDASAPHPVAGHAPPWDGSELAMARALHNSVGSFIERHNQELARLNHKLSAKSAEMEELIYSVSHDLKSPLVTSQGYVGLLLEDLEADDREAVIDSAKRIQRASAQMSRLIDDLLEHSRIGKEGDAKPATQDVNALAALMKSLYAERLAEVGAEIVVKTDVPSVRASAVDLERIFDNLISNAIKYACVKPGGLIEIGGIRDRFDVRYYVRDNGPGIEPRYHEKIFRLFQRLDQSRDGTGVGLASVAKVMQAYRGRVWVDSVPGEGATFWFAFPAEGNHAADTKAPESE